MGDPARGDRPAAVAQPPQQPPRDELGGQQWPERDADDQQQRVRREEHDGLHCVATRETQAADEQPGEEPTEQDPAPDPSR